MSSYPPRPILKRSQTSQNHQAYSHHHPNHAVHFPPSPSLTRTFTAHSPSTYDRSPIVVGPNTCALPERGCPGRTFTLDESITNSTTHCSRKGPPFSGRGLHPRALANNYSGWALPNPKEHDDEYIEDFERTPTRTIPPLPALVHDLSSESSEESDGFSNAPSEHNYHSIPSSSCSSRIYNRGLPVSQGNSHDRYPHYSSFDVINGSITPDALSFLPHPPSPHQHTATREDDGVHKTRRRRERRRERSLSRERDRDRDRVRDSDASVEDLIPTPRKSSRSGSSRSISICKAMSNFSFEDSDNGCLGGF